MQTFVAQNSETASAAIKRTFRSLCSKFDSPIGRQLARASDCEIAMASVNPSLYSCANAFKRDYLLVSYLSKYSDLDTGLDTKAIALGSFEAAETLCKVSNIRLRSGVTSIVDPVIHGASRLIAQLLGEFNLEKLYGGERWGPGSTVEFTRPEAYLDTKISSLPFTVTAAAAGHFLKAIQTDVHWAELLKTQLPANFTMSDLIEVIPGSRITTVPKNAKTDRTIAIEPRGNMFLQKAAGSYIRSRLKRVGVDLDNQSINQDLAFEAILKRLATLDLKSASDTVCKELIWTLLPYDWASYLDQIRSRSFTLDGESYRPFEKFSSMGNGFTFELESLIFWALTRATCESSVSGNSVISSDRVCAVYGDDIICPQDQAWPLTTVLNFCGFEINLTKSFYEGNFFESCGKHYFSSIDVTPIYQKKGMDENGELVRAHNRLVRYAQRWVPGYGRPDFDTLTKAAAKLLDRIVDRSARMPFLPLGADGDDGYLLSIPEMKKYGIKPKLDRNQGMLCTVVRVVHLQIPANEHALYTYTLREISPRCGPLIMGCLDLTSDSADDQTDLGLQDSRSAQSQRTVYGTRWVHAH